MLSTNNNGRTSALPFIFAGMMLLPVCTATYAADAPANTISVSVQNGEIVCSSSVTNGSIPKPGGDVHTNNTAFRLDNLENLSFRPQLPADATNVQVAVSLTGKADKMKLRWNNAVLPSAAAGQRVDVPQDKMKKEGNVLRITAAGDVLSVKSVTFYFAVPGLVNKSTDKKLAGELLELVIEDMKWRFHYCPAGAFTMGSPLSEANRGNDEQLHPVTLSQGFWMGETEVTQAQWESVMGGNPSHFKGEKLPVEKVSWDACQEFVKKLNALGAAPKGYKFSLPTESQWEYACRAGSTTAYCFGDSADSLGAYCWHSGNSGSTTHEVGTKKANAWGLYDMHGNVWEWCNDWYGDYPSPTASSSELADPVGASSGSYRVYRGGSWLSGAKGCRSANRNANTPDFTNVDLGVRVSLVSGQ
ncbi:MAG: formylglycine-generating enzyme family protein [Planctomycetaceae bacterium]|nr:formylglycine-generating enzyme family protein [Planctomycetaceae bacterium]